MRLAHRFSAYAILLFAFAMAGCEGNRYEVQLRPVDATMRRELTCWREQATKESSTGVAFPGEELGRIAAAYDAPVPAEKATKHKFAGEFIGQMPNDVGGSGSYTHWTTTLGSVSGYVERFRGQDDLVTDVEGRLRAADRLVDILIGWLTTRLESEPGFNQLREFLDGDFRRDLKNLSLYSWTSNYAAAHEEMFAEESSIRMGQYLIERGYFTPDQLPMLSRAAMEIIEGDHSKMSEWVERGAAAKMGIAPDQPIPDGLRILSDYPALEASLDEYLRDTDDFRTLLEKWKRDNNPMASEAEQPAPNQVIGDLIASAFLPSGAMARRDKLKVNLECPMKPHLTNGKWDEASKQVQWSAEMQPSDAEWPSYPTLLYAFWSTPDEQQQIAHFGKLVLENDALGQYCVWYRGLTEKEAAEWNEFIATLKPGDELVGQLKKFRFSHEPPASRNDGLAGVPRNLFLQGLADTP